MHPETLRSRRRRLRDPWGGPVDDPEDALDEQLLADVRAPTSQPPDGVSRPDVDPAPQHDVTRVDTAVDPERGDPDRLAHEHPPPGDVHSPEPGQQAVVTPERSQPRNLEDLTADDPGS